MTAPLRQPPGRSVGGVADLSFRQRFFPGVSARDWARWQWQLGNRLRTQADLERVFSLSDDERAALAAQDGQLPVAITPYYASLLARDDASDGLRRTHIPVLAETQLHEGEYDDPLGEDKTRPSPCIVHRYPDRVLFLVTHFCASYCRYCTRARLVGHTEAAFNSTDWQAGLDYIRLHPQIRDVLISGGDPLTLPDARLAMLLQALRAIPHVEIIRIGTKVPIVLPQRITPALCRMLKKFHPLWLSLHVLHPTELTPLVGVALNRLANAGITMGSQTVLLRGVNDDLPVMRRLVHGLLRLRVWPYYLLQLDPIRGSDHFRVPIAKGLELVGGLRAHTSGYACPAYIVDLPGGGGKVQLAPDRVTRREGDWIYFRNFQGDEYRYYDPP